MNAHRSTVTDRDWQVSSVELLGDNFIIRFYNEIRMIIPLTSISYSLTASMRREVGSYITPPLGPEGGLKLTNTLGDAILRYVTTGR